MTTSTTMNGWPDATNTGVPAGVTLTASGDLIITQAGAVISGLNITGMVYIDAPNVTLQNCKITASNYAVVQVASGISGTVVQNCEINGSGYEGSNGISGQGTFIGNNIYNVENGFNVTGSSVIQNNYVHDLYASGSPHYDGIQIDGGISNVTISHNTIINQYGQTSAVMIDNGFGAISNISVDNNILAGGGYTMYDDASQGSASISGVSFTNNHVVSGSYGPTDFNGTNPTYTGNVNDGATLIATLNTPANHSTSTTTSSSTTSATPPAAPVISSFSTDSGVVGDHITNDSTPTVTGTAVANSTVKVFDGSTQVGTATANGSGQWTLTTSTLSDGAHSLTATDTDASGHTSAASTAYSITVDTHAPAAPVGTGYSIVNTNHVQMTGTAEANSAITLYEGTNVVGTGTTNSAGSWSVTTSALSNGSHVLTATATDVAGNVSAMSADLDPVVGTTTSSSSTTTAPTTTPSTGYPDATNTGVPAGVTLSPSGDLTVTQAGAVISGLDIKGTVSILASNVTLVDCKITGSGFADVWIKSGVTGTVVQNCEINGLGTGTNSMGIYGSGTFIGNNIYNVENGIGLTGSSVIKDNYIHDLLAAGSPHYDGIQIDGGISNVTISHNTVINPYGQTSAVMIDNGFGAISNISVNNNILAGGGFTVYSDADQGSAAITGVSFTNNHIEPGYWGTTYFHGNTPVYTGNVNDGATLIATLNTPANHSTSTSTSTSTPPAAPVISSFTTDSGVVGDHITNDSTPTLTGTAVANSTVKVFDGSTQVGTATANGSGQWTLTTSTLKDGAHSLTATDTDASGHTSAASTALSLTIDTHAPAAPVETSDSIVNTNHVLLSGTAEANSAITVHDGTSVVGTGTTNASGSWSVTTSALSSGTHALTATATDVAGNVSAASGALDPVIPTTSTSSSSSSTTTGSSSTTGGSSTTTGHSVQFTGLWESGSVATVKGTADPNSHVNLYEGNTQIGTATASSTGAWSIKTGTLSNTVHTFTAQEVDSTGHVVAKTAGAAIVGTSASDVLTSTGGSDVFFGAGSLDTFNFKAGFGQSVITDGGVGDHFYFSSSEFANFSSLISHASQVGQDTVIHYGADTLTLKNTPLSGLNSADFHFS